MTEQLSQEKLHLIIIIWAGVFIGAVRLQGAIYESPLQAHRINIIFFYGGLYG
jgi:hypothetical protein